jgi:hypothetical protein
MDIVRSTATYEAWLALQLRGEIVVADIQAKRKLMAKNRLRFMRATYWRWAERILDICPQLAGAPAVPAVGDIHAENFGTWRDREGRLIWGVNDFDEAAEMPYVIDIVRLATSAAIAVDGRIDPGEIAERIVKGYRKGLGNPKPIFLDHKQARLAAKFEVGKGARRDFWRDFDPDRRVDRQEPAPPPDYVVALRAYRPEANVQFVYWRRTTGGGSLGRPRWVASGLWRGAPIVREAKAIVPSGWARRYGPEPPDIVLRDIANGPHRSPDPWYHLRGTILVRRLSPNNRKLEFGNGEDPEDLVTRRILPLMGRELAAIHLGGATSASTIRKDLKRRSRKPQWLVEAVDQATEFIAREHAAWKCAYATIDFAGWDARLKRQNAP